MTHRRWRRTGVTRTRIGHPAPPVDLQNPRGHASTLAPARPLLRFVAAVLAVAAAVASMAAQTPSTGRTFLWSASNGKSVVYLVGSVHMLTKDYYPLSPALDAAFEEADLLVEEIDFGQMMAPASQLEMLTRGMLPSGQSLETVLSAETFSQVKGRVTALGLPFEPLQRFKPWMLALTLLGFEWQKAGFDPALGLDRHFYDRAIAERKAIQALETLEFQLSRFDEMTTSEQDRLLVSTLKELDTQLASVTELADAWKAGDAPTIERIVLQALKDEPRLYRRLLIERNQNWLPAIEALFSRPGRALVVVGAAHLVGPDGLIEMLEAKGYTVEQR
jgi:uncharacterized protein YbaP (TraB family)